ncbi:hypothetical protein [Sulfuriroseicoccus oceanibius]|uniref:Lipoprotein n=1 Tax=Sulfuriroseicoccus oceanibius TaxID=2707525 RepID=A0A6B3L736_9BACT|nr:hypothetical protein [Sulfuriroseicoccus oceanibius]QQL44049.1 hypothetical protein G3M56_009100 [Sulfuriroseicoccus oceanibius]
MKFAPLTLALLLSIFGCGPQSNDADGLDSQPAIQLVQEHLRAIHMDDRVDDHYSGGDIGKYLSQFVWSDAAMIMARDQFDPFIEFFDSLRAAARNQNLTEHSPIDNWEIAMIFHEAFPDEDIYGETQFGDIDNTPLPLDKFYRILEQYRSRASRNPKG